jgi:hypothetical protein
VDQYLKCPSRVRGQPRTNTYWHPEKLLRTEKDDEDPVTADVRTAASSVNRRHGGWAGSIDAERKAVVIGQPGLGRPLKAVY